MTELLSDTNADRLRAFRLYNMLIEVNEKLLKGLSYEKILDFLFSALEQVIPYDRIGIALLEKSGPHSKLKLNWVKAKLKIEYLNLPYISQGISPSLQKILDTNEPRIINNLLEYLEKNPDSVPTQLIVKDGIRSSLTCPVLFENKAIGFIFFSSAQIDTYDQQHIEVFQQIANEISVIVSHGKLQQNFDQSEFQTRNINMTLHDLKSPLGVLQGFAEISQDRPWFKNLDPEGKLVFETFFRNTRYMVQLVTELNELISLKNGSDVCDIKTNELMPFLKEMSQQGQQIADQKEIFFRINLASPLPEQIDFDPHKLKRVLVNLFSNAVKFSKRKSEINFHVNTQEDRLYFSVIDQGQGIPENEFPRLFQEFGKTSTRPTEGESSTGQGLAIAKNIIDQHLGQISVASQVGVGSTFSFWIPTRQGTSKKISSSDKLSQDNR